jgi:hypothetical protein
VPGSEFAQIDRSTDTPSERDAHHGRHGLPYVFFRMIALLRRLTLCAALLVVGVCAGCGVFATHHAAKSPTGVPIENPMFISGVPADFLWNQIVDAVDDDYRIEREQRPTVGAGVITEGILETYPTTGSTLLEPWRGDSTSAYQRTLATLQSIRRRASLRVAPTDGGYLVYAVVTHDLEDVSQPERSTVAQQTVRYDNATDSTDIRGEEAATTLGWIPLGRDPDAETKLLADIQSRVTNVRP